MCIHIDSEEPTPTHIYWYKNDGTDAFEKRENVSINVGVDIPVVIVCISGTAHNRTYDHAIEMKIYYEHGHWYDDDGWIDTETDDITVHGWMMPPSWEEGGEK